MNVIYKATLANLHLNRVRTIVTIIGVMLSVALVTAVASSVASLQQYLIQGEIEQAGSWHLAITNVDKTYLDDLSADSQVESTVLVQSVGYAPLDMSANRMKPYLYVAGFDEAAFDNLPVRVVEGRLPINSSELIIPEPLFTNGGVKYDVGDRLTLDLGYREYDGERVGQAMEFMSGNYEPYLAESLTVTDSRTYTVVGIYRRPGFEPLNAPGYTAITIADSPATASTVFDVYITLSHPRSVYDYAQSAASPNNYMINRELLRYLGFSDSDSFNTLLYGMGGTLIALIMVGSVLLIHNAFAISLSERSRQFGLLASVGATKTQLRRSVLFEGACIGLIGIPAGIGLGLVGIGLTLRYIGGIFSYLTRSDLPLSLSIQPAALLVAAMVGMATILVSAYIPARRAIAKSVIEIIRQTEDLQIKARRVKTSRLAEQLFKLEGTLAIKNFRRNRRRYRSTVVSLATSVVLFVSASSFGLYLQKTADLVPYYQDYDIALTVLPSTYRQSDAEVYGLYGQLAGTEGVYDSVFMTSQACSAYVDSNLLNPRFVDAWSADSAADGEFPLYLTLCFVDEDTYNSYLEGLGLSPDEYSLASGRLIATAQFTWFGSDDPTGTAYDMFKGRSVELDFATGWAPESWTDEPRHAELQIVDDPPQMLSAMRYDNLVVYAPYSERDLMLGDTDTMTGISMLFLSTDAIQTGSSMTAILRESNLQTGYSLKNIAEEQARNRDLILVVNVFTYGFVIMMSLITVASVFNTISTSIILRRREIAMLKSVGMTNRGLSRMMGYECVFYGCKALLYGLPVAALVAYRLYLAVLSVEDVAFTLPWMSIAISIAGVFTVVFVTMLYSLAKLNGENTVDVLKSEI
ncbi:MAG: ABC transporter permease [Coriobacteriia bacterium]|nr:ABC transporter permease [Coriobacteriia bacterium]